MDAQARKELVEKQAADLKVFTDAQKAHPKASDVEDLKEFKLDQAEALKELAE